MQNVHGTRTKSLPARACRLGLPVAGLVRRTALRQKGHFVHNGVDDDGQDASQHGRALPSMRAPPTTSLLLHLTAELPFATMTFPFFTANVCCFPACPNQHRRRGASTWPRMKAVWTATHTSGQLQTIYKDGEHAIRQVVQE